MSEMSDGVAVDAIVEDVRAELLRDRESVSRAVEAALDEVVEADGREAVVVTEDPLTVTERAAGQVRGLAAAHFAGDVD